MTKADGLPSAFGFASDITRESLRRSLLSLDGLTKACQHATDTIRSLEEQFQLSFAEIAEAVSESEKSFYLLERAPRHR